jgi:hypothetical protein
MGLGPVHTIGLADARRKAADARRQLLDGIDPVEVKGASRAAVAASSSKRLTFEAAAERYIEAHKAGWRNGKHAEQWRNTLRTYAFPVFRLAVHPGG